jgi:glucose-fructose oxidoreductase
MIRGVNCFLKINWRGVFPFPRLTRSGRLIEALSYMNTPSAKKHSRREFLRDLSLGTAAFAGGIGFAESAKSQQIAPNPPKKLGVALLGLGRYATNELAPAFKQTRFCQLTGVVSGHPEKAAQWAAQYNLPQKNLYNYDDLDSIANNPDIDIVYVVTPPALHPEYVIRAAKAGKHVISEKPMATSVADCQAMIDACKKAGVKFSIGYRMHFDPYAIELMRLQRDGDFGPFMKITGDFSFVMRQHEWRIEKKLGGGGPMMDLGIYIVQAACMATGQTPIAVTAREEPKQRPDFFTEVEETLDFHLEFPDGAVCDAVTSFNRSGGSFRAEGSKGWIDFQTGAFGYRVGTVVTSRGPLQYPNPYQQALQMDDFAQCILNNRETPVPGEMGLRDMKIVTAIYEAAATGKRIVV